MRLFAPPIPFIAFTAGDHWEPGIGDPTVIGWVTVVAYFVAAALCWRAAWIARRRGPPALGQRVFWSVFTVGLVFLGINKQLDLQTWLTFAFKNMALHEGWYEKRRPVQAAFIGMIAIAGVASLAGMRRLAGEITRPIRVGLIGGLFLGCFIVIRAASFHHVDRLLGMDLGGLKVNWILELGSISCIALAAWMARKSPLPPGIEGPGFLWVSAGDRPGRREP